jgi:hypothetical protein
MYGAYIRMLAAPPVMQRTVPITRPSASQLGPGLGPNDSALRVYNCADRERHEHLSLHSERKQASRMIGLASFELNRVAYIQTLSDGPGALVTKPFILKCRKSVECRNVGMRHLPFKLRRE